MNTLPKSDDIEGLLQVLDSDQKRRPRDPFLLVQRAYFSFAKNGPRSTELVLSANECAAAAALVPTGAIYDEYRKQFSDLASNPTSVKSVQDIIPGVIFDDATLRK